MSTPQEEAWRLSKAGQESSTVESVPGSSHEETRVRRQLSSGLPQDLEDDILALEGGRRCHVIKPEL
jgi:hypothetical protein